MTALVAQVPSRTFKPALLDLGTIGSSAVLAIIFVTFIAYTTLRDQRASRHSGQTAQI